MLTREKNKYPCSIFIIKGRLFYQVTTPKSSIITDINIQLLLNYKKKLSRQCRNVIGNDVHFEVLEGASLIQEESELNIDTTWTRTPPTHPLPRFAGTYDVPISIRLDSEFVSMQMEGWETTKKYRYMHKPVVASINLAEGNIRPLLQRLNPLLTDVVSVHSTSPLVKIKVSPAEALWPAEQLEVSMSPLNIGIGQGAVLRNALSVLTLADR